MRLGEYLEINNLNYDDVILKKENGEIITSFGCLIDYCDILEINGNEIIIRWKSDFKEELNMFTRLNKTIIEAIHKVFNESVCDFSKWWQDDFETDYGYDTEEELKSFTENELDCVKGDWVYSVADGFVSQTLTELGIISSVIETDSQQVIIEEIYDIVKDELMKKIEAEWK